MVFLTKKKNYFKSRKHIFHKKTKIMKGGFWTKNNNNNEKKQIKAVKEAFTYIPDNWDTQDKAIEQLEKMYASLKLPGFIDKKNKYDEIRKNLQILKKKVKEANMIKVDKSLEYYIYLVMDTLQKYIDDFFNNISIGNNEDNLKLYKDLNDIFSGGIPNNTKTYNIISFTMVNYNNYNNKNRVTVIKKICNFHNILYSCSKTINPEFDKYKKNKQNYIDIINKHLKNKIRERIDEINPKTKIPSQQQPQQQFPVSGSNNNKNNNNNEKKQIKAVKEAFTYIPDNWDTKDKAIKQLEKMYASLKLPGFIDKKNKNDLTKSKPINNKKNPQYKSKKSTNYYYHLVKMVLEEYINKFYSKIEEKTKQNFNQPHLYSILEQYINTLNNLEEYPAFDTEIFDESILKTDLENNKNIIKEKEELIKIIANFFNILTVCLNTINNNNDIVDRNEKFSRNIIVYLDGKNNQQQKEQQQQEQQHQEQQQQQQQQQELLEKQLLLEQKEKQLQQLREQQQQELLEKQEKQQPHQQPPQQPQPQQFSQEPQPPQPQQQKKPTPEPLYIEHSAPFFEYLEEKNQKGNNRFIDIDIGNPKINLRVLKFVGLVKLGIKFLNNKEIFEYIFGSDATKTYFDAINNARKDIIEEKVLYFVKTFHIPKTIIDNIKNQLLKLISPMLFKKFLLSYNIQNNPGKNPRILKLLKCEIDFNKMCNSERNFEIINNNNVNICMKKIRQLYTKQQTIEESTDKFFEALKKLKVSELKNYVELALKKMQFNSPNSFYSSLNNAVVSMSSRTKKTPQSQTFRQFMGNRFANN